MTGEILDARLRGYVARAVWARVRLVTIVSRVLW